MHQYHLGTDEDEKEGEYVVSKIFTNSRSNPSSPMTHVSMKKPVREQIKLALQLQKRLLLILLELEKPLPVMILSMTLYPSHLIRKWKLPKNQGNLLMLQLRVKWSTPHVWLENHKELMQMVLIILCCVMKFLLLILIVLNIILALLLNTLITLAIYHKEMVTQPVEFRSWII